MPSLTSPHCVSSCLIKSGSLISSKTLLIFQNALSFSCHVDLFIWDEDDDDDDGRKDGNY